MIGRSILAALLLAGGLLPASSDAATIVRFVLADPGVAPGASTTLEIRADFDTPVLGFGVDLVLDPAVLAAVSAPVIGPAWTPVFAPDGDGLAGLALPAGVVGSDVLLASLAVTRLSPARTQIGGAITAGDLSEGFPLVGSGFDPVTFVPAAVAAVPEPTAAMILGILAGWFSVRGRSRRGS